MNIKTTSKILFLLLTICLILNSCIFDTKSAYCIRNCTNDTLLIDMTETSNLDSCWMYWGKHSEDLLIQTYLILKTRVIFMP